MSLAIPAELKWLEWVVGADWPEGDEDRLRTCAEAWSTAASEVRQLVPAARLAGAEAVSAVDGDVALALESYWHKFTTGDDGHLGQLAGACDELARLCERTALEVEYAKYQFILALIALAVTIVILLASAAETFGASTAGIPVAEVATQSVVRAIALRLLKAIAAGAATNVALDLVAQAFQAIQGHRHDWDTSKTVGAAESGAIFGAVAGGVHLSGQRFAPQLSQTLGGRLVAGTVTGGLGAELTAVATGAPLSVTDFLKSTTAGLAQTAAESSHGVRNHPVDDLIPPDRGAEVRDGPSLDGSVDGSVEASVDASVADRIDLLLAGTPGDAPPSHVDGPSVEDGTGQGPAGTGTIGLAGTGTIGLAGAPQHAPAVELGPDGSTSAPPAHQPSDATATQPAPGGPAAAIHPSTLERDNRPPPLPLTDAESLAVVREHVHRTRAGYAFYPPGDETLGFAATLRRRPAYVTLDVHGSPAGFHLDDRLLTPEQFAAAIKAMAAEGKVQLPDGVRFKLASCETGAGADPPAARLARALGAEVMAPTERLWTTVDGHEVVTSAELSGGRWVPKHPPDGFWRSFPPEPEAPAGVRQELERHLAESGRSIADVVREAPDLAHLRDSGVRPDEIARHVDGAALRRLAPALDEPGIEDLRRFLGDDRVRDALGRSWDEPARGGGETLADALLRGLIEQPELVRVMQGSEVLMHSLTQRPGTIESLLRHPQAVDVLAGVVAEVRERGVEAVLGDGVPAPEPTPLADWQKALSMAIGPAGREATQPGFVRRRRRDPAYLEGYLHDLYHKAADAQRELNDFAGGVAASTGGEASYRTEPKRWRRTMDKLAGLDGDASRLTDLAAGTIQYDTLTDLYRGLGEIRRRPGARIVFYHDRFLHPLDTGYRDIQLKLRLPGGHIVELQLHLRAIRDVAGWEHALFEVRRDLASLAGRDGIRGEAQAIADSLVTRAQGHYSDALRI